MNNDRKQRGKLKESVVFPVVENRSDMPSSYFSFVTNLKDLIQKEKFKAILSANQRMILMYWHIGKAILQKQEAEG